MKNSSGNSVIRVSEDEIKETRNIGQWLERNDFAEHWIGTIYTDGGFDYEIRPVNLESKNTDKIEERVEMGENRDDIITDLCEKYINLQEKELGIDKCGYVSKTGRVYTDSYAATLAESEKEGQETIGEITERIRNSVSQIKSLPYSRFAFWEDKEIINGVTGIITDLNNGIIYASNDLDRVFTALGIDDLNKKEIELICRETKNGIYSSDPTGYHFEDDMDAEEYFMNNGHGEGLRNYLAYQALIKRGAEVTVKIETV